MLVEGVATTHKRREAKLHHISSVSELTELRSNTSGDVSSRRRTSGDQIVDGEVLQTVNVHSVLGHSTLLVEGSDDSIKLVKASDSSSGGCTRVNYYTTVLDGREVTFRTSDRAKSRQTGVRYLLTQQHHHLTLVEEALTSVVFRLDEPAVVAVAQVDPADVGSLRTRNLVNLFEDLVRVGTLNNV